MSPTKAQLLDYASRLGVDADESMTKDEITDAINARKSSSASPDEPAPVEWWQQPGAAPPADE